MQTLYINKTLRPYYNQFLRLARTLVRERYFETFRRMQRHVAFVEDPPGKDSIITRDDLMELFQVYFEYNQEVLQLSELIINSKLQSIVISEQVQYLVEASDTAYIRIDLSDEEIVVLLLEDEPEELDIRGSIVEVIDMITEYIDYDTVARSVEDEMVRQKFSRADAASKITRSYWK